MCVVQKTVFKIIILGETGVGKTAMILKAKTKSFPDPEFLKSTIGIAHHSIELGEDKEMVVWDFGGQQHFKRFISSMFKGAHGGIFVFDLSSPLTLDALERYWIPEVQSKVGDLSTFILVGNKADLEQKVPDEEIEKFAKKYGFKFYKISAKNDDTMVLFKELYELILNSLEM